MHDELQRQEDELRKMNQPMVVEDGEFDVAQSR